MSSRRPVRQGLVAVLLGVLVGGGLMAVTPAGAEVSQAVATNWKKIWKKEIRPQTDKRYYTKKKSDSQYQPKGSYEPAGSGYTKAETYTKGESDAKYAGAGSSYTKAESDAKHAPFPKMSQGTFWGLGDFAVVVPINWGETYSAAPTPHVILPGASTPVGCSGNAAAPVASPGNLCVFVTGTSATGTVGVFRSGGSAGTDPFGANVLVNAAGNSYLRGSWASAPVALAPGVGARVTPTPRGGTPDSSGVVR